MIIIDRNEISDIVDQYGYELVNFILNLSTKDGFDHAHLIQYLNNRIVVNLFRFSGDLMVWLDKNGIVYDNSLLNIGTGIGSFEYMCEFLGKYSTIPDSIDIKYKLESGEVIDVFEIPKKYFKVKNMFVEDIFSNSFKIPSDKKYKCALAARFVVLTHLSNNLVDLKKVLHNISKYTDRLISIEQIGNFKSKEVLEFLKIYETDDILKFTVFDIDIKDALRRLQVDVD